MGAKHKKQIRAELLRLRRGRGCPHGPPWSSAPRRYSRDLPSLQRGAVAGRGDMRDRTVRKRRLTLPPI